MAPKSKRSWFDVQMAIMTIAMAAVLGLWNLFAGPDRETASRKAAEELAKNQQPEPIEEPVTVQATPVPLPKPGEKIMLGGSAPQTQVTIQRGGGGGGGGGVTSTSSS